jgi:hypothetical protein
VGVAQNTELNLQAWGHGIILSCQSLSVGEATQLQLDEISNILDYLEEFGSELKSEQSKSTIVLWVEGTSDSHKTAPGGATSEKPPAPDSQSHQGKLDSTPLS